MVQLNDGRWLMARKDDIFSFIRQHEIIGKEIVSILPSELDYSINNLYEVMAEQEDIMAGTCECGINTDGTLCLLFADGSSMEIIIPGESPVILGYNTAKLDKYPKGRPGLFSLNTMFQHCRLKRIKDVLVDYHGRPLLFPCFMGIDMSQESDGVWRIRLILDDDTALAFSGHFDFGHVDHMRADGTWMRIPTWQLLDVCPANMINAQKENDYWRILTLARMGLMPIPEKYGCTYLWELQFCADEPEERDAQLKIVQWLLEHGESPIAEYENETLLDRVCWKLFNDSFLPEEEEYLRKFFILLVAYGGSTEYCAPQILKPFDKSKLYTYHFLIGPHSDGHHYCGQIRDAEDHLMALV